MNSCKRLAAASLAAALLCLAGCRLSGALSKEDIFRLVELNYDTLSGDVASGNFERSEGIRGITEVRADGGIVDFYCGGSGSGSATGYYGFYYSADGDMTAIWCAGPVTASGEGYMYRQPDGDNSYYTENIIGGFYYYEAHF